MRKWFAAAALVLLAACATSNATTVGPADVAAQSSDLPSGLLRCDGSGDIDTFLNSVQTKDPTTYQSTKASWDSAKTHDATSAEVIFYADTKAHCAGVQSSGSDLGSATYPVVINFVIQFKDEAAAAKGYTTESIFGFSESAIGGSTVGSVKGTDTGLTKNSVSLTVAFGNQTFYVAVWQNKAFMVILGVFNIDKVQAKKVATNETSRIR
jgi:hypothetical protein